MWSVHELKDSRNIPAAAVVEALIHSVKQVPGECMGSSGGFSDVDRACRLCGMRAKVPPQAKMMSLNQPNLL